MMTHLERILKVAAGKMVDKMPYVPRIDLWYNANAYMGTLPEKHKGRSMDEIARTEGWALHKLVPEMMKFDSTEQIMHRGLGLYDLKEWTYVYRFSPDVDIRVEGDETQMRIEYHTPVGMVSVSHGLTEEMKQSGASIAWIQEHAIKDPKDYRVLAHIFGNMKFEPSYDRYVRWNRQVGEDGLCAEQSIGLSAGSPVHYIQKILIDATEFFIHYKSHRKEMQELEEALAHCYDQIIPIIAESPAQAVVWDSNVDSMITYPDYLEKDILPWWKKAVDAFHAKGKLVIVHPDGENEKIMDLLADSGVDVCEAVAPYPMTRVTIDEYYERWCRSDKVTIFGGIPESMLLEKSTTEEEFEAYLDHFFKAVAPGKRLIVGIGDTTPPAAVFERLIRMAERFETEGRLPLEAGAARFLSQADLKKKANRIMPPANALVDRLIDKRLQMIQDDVLKGNREIIKEDVKRLLDENYSPSDILNLGMLSAMEIIGERFKDGTVFIPEVLLSARAMNEALTILEPFLSTDKSDKAAKILIGTVHGDLHDIGKNMVCTMLKGVGFDVVDLGINVPVDDFVKKVSEHKPDILGISALLTTTMPQMQKVIESLAEAGLRSDLKIIIGGAPVNQKFCDDIGADGYAQDAGDAVALVKRLVKDFKK
jgi:corrinoid protein of di/trimethylamine methyltransferase